MERVRADHILDALARRYKTMSRGYGFWVGVKTGPTTIARKGDLGILDAVAVKKSWTEPEVIGYEVKVTRQDFLRDEKWPRYLDHTHRLYFVCPPGVIASGQVDERLGLMWYNPGTDRITVKKTAVYRHIPFPVDLMVYLVMHRLEDDRHPYFTDRRAALAAWLALRETSIGLARTVRSRLIDRLAENERQLAASQEQVGPLQRKAEAYDTLLTLLQARGLITAYDMQYGPSAAIQQRVGGALRMKSDRQVVGRLNWVMHELETLRTWLAEPGAKEQKHADFGADGSPPALGADGHIAEGQGAAAASEGAG